MREPGSYTLDELLAALDPAGDPKTAADLMPFVERLSAFLNAEKVTQATVICGMIGIIKSILRSGSEAAGDG